MMNMKETKLPTPAVTTEENTVAEPSHKTTLGDISSPVREVSTSILTTTEMHSIDPITIELKT
jgi:hypothetical protein